MAATTTMSTVARSFLTKSFGRRASVTQRLAVSFPIHRRSFSSTNENGIQLYYDWLNGPQKAVEDQHPYDHVVLFMHGLLGNGRNIRTMAKKLCESSQQPGLLLDVRGHGKSKVPTSTTTSFESCVQDLHTTLDSIPQVTSDTAVTLVGHSLGGRISLQYAYDNINNNSNNKLNRVWLLDTVPGEANESVERVVAAVTEISSKAAITDRKELIQQLTSPKYGIDNGTANWLASSLQKNKQDDTLDFAFDLAVVTDLLADFHSQDFMEMLDSVLTKGVQVDIVRGGKNTGWKESNLGPLREMEKKHPRNFGMHLLPTAGHWVHVDDLPGLLEVMDVSK